MTSRDSAPEPAEEAAEKARLGATARPVLFDPRRLAALMRKESRQIVRDPSAIIVAFVLPVILLLLFAFAVSLDVDRVRLGLVVEGDGSAARELAAAFDATRYFDITRVPHRKQAGSLLVGSQVRGFVVIPQSFDRDLLAGHSPELQVVTDGTQPNTANFVSGYANGVLATWLSSRTPTPTMPVSLEERAWYNPEIESRRFLVPGAIAIVMTMIGTLLTALVVAREWERGTMEALMATPAVLFEILLGKLLPYFALGLAATLGCAAVATWLLDVPLRGSVLALLALSSAFLVPALGQGLLISAASRDQFIASQVALFSGFLPAFLLSGFIFSIDSMPAWIRLITTVIPARYFVSGLETVFLVGDVWSIFVPDILAMLAVGTVFFVITAVRTRKSLD